VKYPKQIKKVKVKKAKKVSKSTLKNKADKLFSLFVRSLDHCERDGEVRYLQTAHIYSRRYVNLRYDIQNVLCLCARCHRWAHDNPLDFVAWFNSTYPERYAYLKKKKKIIRKWVVDDYLKVIEEIKNYIR